MEGLAPATVSQGLPLAWAVLLSLWCDCSGRGHSGPSPRLSADWGAFFQRDGSGAGGVRGSSDCILPWLGGGEHPSVCSWEHRAGPGARGTVWTWKETSETPGRGPAPGRRGHVGATDEKAPCAPRGPEVKGRASRREAGGRTGVSCSQSGLLSLSSLCLSSPEWSPEGKRPLRPPQGPCTYLPLGLPVDGGCLSSLPRGVSGFSSHAGILRTSSSPNKHLLLSGFPSFPSRQSPPPKADFAQV